MCGIYSKQRNYTGHIEHIAFCPETRLRGTEPQRHPSQPGQPIEAWTLAPSEQRGRWERAPPTSFQPQSAQETHPAPCTPNISKTRHTQPIWREGPQSAPYPYDRIATKRPTHHKPAHAIHRLCSAQTNCIDYIGQLVRLIHNLKTPKRKTSPSLLNVPSWRG
jgi:hypothetical protein